MIMKKAFFINGGAGRVLCSMPALEWYKQNIDDDLIIVSEGWSELYLANKVLRDHVYDVGHKNLFREKLIDRDLCSPEPYRFNPYFNQKINLIQAFDMLINDLTDIPKTKSVNLEINKIDQMFGYNFLSQVRNQYDREKVVVFQPFGQGAVREGAFIIDSSGRSFEVRDIVRIIKELSKDYAVVLMTNIEIPTEEPLGAAIPQANLLQWMGIINACDYFLGCDSLGQHYASALDKPATVVIGSTFPENISYPDNKKFTIIDNGKDLRMFNPFRVAPDFVAERNNEDLMILDDKTLSSIIKSVKKTLGVPKYKKNTNISSNLNQSNPVQLPPIDNHTHEKSTCKNFNFTRKPQVLAQSVSSAIKPE